MSGGGRQLRWALALAPMVSCSSGGTSAPAVAPSPPSSPPSSVTVVGLVSNVPGGDTPAGQSEQLVVVTTAGWDSTRGTLRRYGRQRAGEAWRAEGDAVPIVVGRTGLAWGDPSLARAPSEPLKREGDGRAPAGAFALDTAFGFPPASASSWVRLPYVPITEGTECVDDVKSSHYNTVVDRHAVPTVDWTTAEPMRRIDQYRLGVVVAYNALPRRAGRGSCIFLHIWAGPDTPTNGCTAMPEHDLTQLVLWLDPARHPMLVQLPEREYARLRDAWRLP